jgi:Cu+-exporting ATPase
MVVSLGIDKGTKQGILIKGGKYLEKLSSIDTLIFDKTGTLTKGKPEVTDIISNEYYDESKVLQLAYSVEVKSEHPIAHAIVKKAEKENITALGLSDFSAISGRGVLANYAGKKIFVGGPLYHKVEISQTMENKISTLESNGKTVIVIILDNVLVGIIAVADTLRDNAKQVINEIKNMGKNVILMSGDNKRTVVAIGQELGIDCVLAEVLPETKAYEVKKLQIQGKKVIMVGDGINDAPALTQADVGIAIGSGTDVAMAAGHVILMKSDLQNVVFALKIGEYSLKKIKQNLTISFAYNAITIPIAAGILFGITNSLILTPGLAALGWIISDGAVFGNSMLMKKIHESH